MTPDGMTEDGQAVLLLCSTLALPQSDSAPKPLSRTEWNDLARAIRDSRLERPGALLGATSADVSRELAISETFSQRIRLLLDRGAQLAIERERLASRGIWALTRADERYPARLKERLKALAPPVLFGAGTLETLNRTSLAVVGSRDVDEAGAAFAATLGRLCAESQLSVVSGAARGVDRMAVEGALGHGGRAVAVLADSLEEFLKRRDVRDPVLDERLTVLTPSHPASRFTAAAAMGRNKLIYGLGSWAVVVSSALDAGGTWAGATENLSAGWTPLFVRDGDEAPEGNRALIEKGGRPFSLDRISMPISTWFEEASRQPADAAGHADAAVSDPVALPVAIQAAPTSGQVADLFVLGWPHLATYLSQPRTMDEVIAAFALERAQVKAWLDRAVAEGKATKLKAPVRFQAAASTPADTLF